MNLDRPQVTVRKQDRDLLAAIAADPTHVTFHRGHQTPPATRDKFQRNVPQVPDRHGHMPPFLRYVTCTAPVRRLLQAGLVEHQYRSGSPVTVTQRGRDWLAAHDATAQEVTP